MALQISKTSAVGQVWEGLRAFPGMGRAPPAFSVNKSFDRGAGAPRSNAKVFLMDHFLMDHFLMDHFLMDHFTV